MKRPFGSRRTLVSAPTLDATLIDFEDQQWSGCVSISGYPGPLRIFLFEGGVYSCLVDGDPGFGGTDELVRRRMEVSGLEPDDRGADTIIQRGSIHQERLLAFLSQASSSTVESCDEGRTTPHNCALPLAWSLALPVLEARERRLRTDSGVLLGGSSGDTDGGSLQVVTTHRPSTGICEQDFFLDALIQPTSIDAAAYSCGFTRAEAIHLAAKLRSTGHLAVLGTEDFASQALAVPEAWKPTRARE